MQEPNVGELYHVIKTSNNIIIVDEIIEIIKVPDTGDSSLFFYGVGRIQLNNREDHPHRRWSQYRSDFESMLDGTHDDYLFVKVSKDENPEFWL